MSKSALRKDKTCLNCSHVVDQRFCPNCGQENTESRKTFYHLFVHFFEDLTHYENAFWRTIKNLLFKPSALTKEYLSGKRLSYLAPVRLYIFISFITFFLITVIPNSEDPVVKRKQTPAALTTSGNGKQKDSIITTGRNQMRSKEIQTKAQDSLKGTTRSLFDFKYKSVKQLDSVQQNAPASERLSKTGYWIAKKIVTVTEHNSNAEVIEKFKESFIHNFPKVLFIYMPLFAFFLWIFHGKKRWYYFDHGIFTLHYFSFLLLIVLILFLTDYVLTALGDSGFISLINIIIHFVGYTWMFYYFFPAHHRFYGETRWVSFIKTSALIFINCILISFILIAFALYTFINLH